MSEKIRLITGPRGMEYPFIVALGRKYGEEEKIVTYIDRREKMSREEIGWFDIYSGEELLGSFNERHVAEVQYVEG